MLVRKWAVSLAARAPRLCALQRSRHRAAHLGTVSTGRATRHGGAWRGGSAVAAAAVSAAAVVGLGAAVSSSPVDAASMSQRKQSGDIGYQRKYRIIAGPAPELHALAKRLEAADPERFSYYESRWGKFPDGSDHITLGGFPGGEWNSNKIHSGHLLFLASFHNNDVSLSQFYALATLCESFPASITILLPFLPTATMERIVEEGEVATANTLAKMFNNLPSVGPPHRVMMYDLHTLQNRFYFAGNALATLHTAFPLLIQKMQAADCNIDCVAFPDDGAQKRFGSLFKKAFPEMELVTCAKKRDPVDPVHGKKKVVICDGDVRGKHVVIVDDMIQSGGTLFECAQTLKQEGAVSISAFCTHAIFPNQSWKRFAHGGDRVIFKKIWLTNSNPTITSTLPVDDCFEILDLTELIVRDLSF